MQIEEAIQRIEGKFAAKHLKDGGVKKENPIGTYISSYDSVNA